MFFKFIKKTKNKTNKAKELTYSSSFATFHSENINLINSLTVPTEYIKNSFKKNTIEKFSHLYEPYKNYEEITEVKTFLDNYEKIVINTKKTNEEFLRKELEEKKEFFSNIANLSLDHKQREAVVKNEDNNLIIAGAGTGKTATIVARCHYLITYKNVLPHEILLISFTKASAEEMRERVSKIDIQLEVKTFHSLGLSILREYENVNVIGEGERNNIFSYFFTEKTHDTKFYKDLINFFSLSNRNTSYKMINTLKGHKVRSNGEKEISDFLFLNGVNYEYKYKPNFVILKENGEELNLDYYELDENLKNTLLQNGITLNEISINIVKGKYEELTKDSKFKEKIKTIKTFLDLFKSNNFNITNLENFKRDSAEVENDLLFFKVFEKFYIFYEEFLKKENKIDFNDMINLSIYALDFVKTPYKHIIIDEFQDTSISKANLIKAIKSQNNGIIFAVGDDWQSIYRFSGSDISIFNKFETFFGYTEESYIERTYRNSQKLIHIAGNFIMKNPEQKKKNLISSKVMGDSLKNPVRIYSFDKSIKNSKIKSFLKCINFIVEKTSSRSILLLGRTNYDIDFLKELEGITITGQNKYREIKLDGFNLNIKFYTIHSSKGLEDSEVIILNNESGIFPSKRSSANVLNYVLTEKDNFLDAEERRLFYVALTRTKNHVFILASSQAESYFVKEIKNMNGVIFEKINPPI